MPQRRIATGVAQRPNVTLLLTGVLSGVILLLAGVSVAATQIMAGVRGYSSGESMWSKGQNDAAYYLVEYAETGEERNWQGYLDNIAIPLGDHAGRLALDNNELDSDEQYRIAFEGFLRGRNHPDDIPMMIFLYRWFAWQPQFQRAIETWQEGDTYILEMVEIGERLRREHGRDKPDPAALRAMAQEIRDIHYEVREVEVRFSRIMGETSRWVQGSLFAFTGLASILLLALGAWVNRRITSQRFETEARYRAAFEQAAMGMAQVSLDLEWLEVNDRLCEMLGYAREDMLDMGVLDVTHPDDIQVTLDHMPDGDEPGLDEMNFDKRYCCANGDIIWCNLNVRLLRDIKGAPLHYVTVVADVTEERRLTEELSHQASHDSLTGLINRYEFKRRMEQALHRARVEHISNALCFVDLDQFKIVNDTCGHGAGDALLKQLGGVLRNCIRSNDTLARLGGDEFALLLEACPPQVAEKVAEKMRKAIQDMRFHWEGQVFNVGASIGLVSFDEEDHDVQGLMSAADAACFTAKEGGRNRVHVAGKDDPRVGEHMSAMQWQQRLRNALEEDRFFLFWQPIMRLDGGSEGNFRDFEILLRLRDEQGEVVPPARFLSAAERFGLIRDIDHWVLEQVISWLAEDAARASEVDRLSINLSGVTISESGFLANVLALFEKYDIPEGKLCFEVTETATITHLDVAMTLIRTLSERGCTFALDDFGMGVSSFAYLNSLPVHCIKIDGTFVRDMDTNPVHAAMVRSINDIAHTMGKQTVAEFVENTEILSHLREIGVDFAQGFGVARPIELGNFDFKT